MYTLFTMTIFKNDFDLPAILEDVRDAGYVFAPRAVLPGVCKAMEREIGELKMELGDHASYPINKDAPNEVRQMHERCYRPLGHPDVPVGTAVCEALSAAVGELRVPELAGWMPNEIGYQRYRGSSDWISPHRDRASDQLLSMTITIIGSAWMRIYESETDPPDYARLRKIDEFLTEPGTMMLLRAPGFGSRKQVIHEVLPPLAAPRLIVNLRMRPTVLKPPNETKWR